MTSIVNIFPYVFPILVVCLAIILLCIYRHAKKKRAAYDVTTPQDDNTSSELYTITLPEDRAEEDRQYDTLPPLYSTLDLPPPYSLFDPKMTNLWPEGSQPASDMFPITLPLEPHHSTTPTGSTPSSSTSTLNHPQPQWLDQESTFLTRL